MTMPIEYAWFAFAGLMFGSFLNVCIYRLPRSESLNFPSSHCTSCNRPLRWCENVPVVGWLALRGRCRTCKAPISPMYPIIEVTTAVLFVGAYAYFGWSLLMVSRLTFACAMLVLLVIDLQHRILPNVITLPGVVAGFILSFATPPGWVSSLLGILLGGGLLWGVAEVYFRVRKEEGLGMGDIKMLGMIGAFLGWKLMLLTLVVSSFLGSFVGISMIATKRGNMKYALPFGTFLAVAAVLAAVEGDRLIAWYVARFY